MPYMVGVNLPHIGPEQSKEEARHKKVSVRMLQSHGRPLHSSHTTSSSTLGLGVRGIIESKGLMEIKLN